MNLMYDKREQQDHPDRSGPDLPNAPGPSKPKKQKIAKKPKAEKLKPPRKGIPKLWLFIFLPLFLLVLAMTYVYYFQRDLLLKPKNNVTIKTRVPMDSSNAAMANDSLAMSNMPGDSTMVADSGEQPAQQTSSAQDTTLFTQTEPAPPTAQTRPQQQRATAPAGSAPSVQLLSTIWENVTPGLTVTSLYIDENTFSVGVKTASSSELNAFYSALTSQLPAGTSITTQPTLSRGQSLLAGTYTGSGANPNARQTTGSSLRTEIRNIIQRNNAAILETSISAPQTWNNLVRAQGFVKMSGRHTDCRNAVREILTSGWDISLSKIIVMPDSNQRGTLVLRFFLNNPA